MRFVIAVILITLYVFIALATSKGTEGLGAFIGYVLGSIASLAIIAVIFCIPKSGRNSKRFFRAYNLVIFLAILGHAGKLAELIESTNKPPQTIVGVNNKIQMTVPGTWLSQAPPSDYVVINLTNESGYLRVVVGYERAGTERPELKRYAQLHADDFKERAPDLKSLSSIKQCDSSNLECVYQVATTTTGEKGVTIIMASLTGEEGYYNFTAITNPGLLSIYRRDIFNAMKSLKEIRDQPKGFGRT